MRRYHRPILGVDVGSRRQVTDATKSCIVSMNAAGCSSVLTSGARVREMDHPLGPDAGRLVAERDVSGRELPEERAAAPRTTGTRSTAVSDHRFPVVCFSATSRS